MSGEATPQEVLRDLARVRVLFQARAIAAALGARPRDPIGEVRP
jgi:hypothetical protein